MLTGSTYGVRATGAYIGKVSVGASYSPTSGISQGFIDGTVGIGVGGGGFTGGQYQWTPVFGTIWQW